MNQAANDLSDEKRKELFAALVNLQDSGVGVAESRAFVAGQYGVNVAVVNIEKEGSDSGWPPL